MRNQNGEYINQLPKSNLIKRALWNVCSIFLFKCFPTSIFRKWRILVLRLFGARIDSKANVYSSAIITCPWNLEMGPLSCLGPHSICDNDVQIKLEENATVSQYAYLCTSSHIIDNYSFDLISEPITIKKDAWVAADSFVGMGVTIGEGAVVGARSSVFKDVAPMTIVGGSPATFIKERLIKK